MKVSQMRDMARDDLVLEEAELRAQLFKLRFQAATGQLESASHVRVVRKGHRARPDRPSGNGAGEAAKKKQGAGK